MDNAKASDGKPSTDRVAPVVDTALNDRVMVVDDEDVNREILGLLFAELGVSICVADGGEAALSSFKQDLPRIILTDLRMPDMDGFALARAIRACEHGSDAVIIALSGAVSQDLAEDPCEAGFDGVLSKPVRLPDLKDVLERYGMAVQGA